MNKISWLIILHLLTCIDICILSFFFKKLSESLHEEEGEHNNDYDHEAFLGREEAKTFDQLTPEESKERLA